MSNKVKNGIITVSAVVAVSALLLRLRLTLLKKTPPDPETSFPEDTGHILIPPGESFKGTVNSDSSGAFFFWDKQDVSGWQFDQGGYVLSNHCSILPTTTDLKKSTLNPGDTYEFVPHNKDDGMLLYTNERNITEKFKVV